MGLVSGEPRVLSGDEAYRRAFDALGPDQERAACWALRLADVFPEAPRSGSQQSVDHRAGIAAAEPISRVGASARPSSMRLSHFSLLV